MVDFMIRRMRGAAFYALLAAAVACPAAAGDFVNHAGMAFAHIPAGNFFMGSCVPAQNKQPCPSGDKVEDDVAGNQTPQHAVKIPAAFEISITPVTAGQFRRFLAARPDVAQTREAALRGGANNSPPEEDGDAVARVRWDEAQAFAAWLNAAKPADDLGRYRLITEAEWEYVARSGNRSRYGWGDATKPGMCSHCGEPPAHDMRVAAFRANRFGVHDMIGHMWEWTADCWRDSYRGAPDDGGVWQGSADCDRVVRGGWRPDFEGGAEPEPVAVRDHADLFFRNELIGFRIARTLPGDPRGPARLEVSEWPQAAAFTPPPPLKPGLTLQTKQTPDVLQTMIAELIQSCRSLDGGVDADPLVKRLRPVFRGLPVTRWDYMASGEGERWGFTFNASPAAVAAAIPEAAQPRRFLIENAPGLVLRTLESADGGGTLLSCGFRNPVSFD